MMTRVGSAGGDTGAYAITHHRKPRWPLVLLAAWLIVSPAGAQGLRGLGQSLSGSLSLPNAVDGLGRTGQLLNQTLDDVPVEDLRRLRMDQLVRSNPKQLEFDDHGAAVVRGEVLAISPSSASLAIASRAGFAVLRESKLESLNLDMVVLTVPNGLAAREALRRLRKLDPDGRYDLDHIYTGAGETSAGAGAEAAAPASPGDQARAGLLDTGVDRGHPAFAGSRIEQKGFAPGGVQVGAHGTAVASLMVGRTGDFRGAAPGARLWVADVYGSGPTGGSADAIASGLAWMAAQRAPVINISLVGPPNLTLEAAVKAVIANGALIVAPVGNDGPAAPPLYPAAYPGVVAVTAFDARHRLLIEAGRAGHVDFSAPGADILAAKPGGGLIAVRGTSFASPIVAGRLALALHAPDRAAALRALAALSGEAAEHGGRIGEDLQSADAARRR